MGAVRMIGAIRARGRLRELVVIALVIAIAGGVVLGAIAGARRTGSALDRLGDDTMASTTAIDLNGGPDAEFARRVGRIPGVEGWSESVVWAASLADQEHGGTPILAAVDDRFGRSVDRSVLVSGRRARTAREVVVPETLAGRMGLRLGSVVRIVTYAPRQLPQLQTGLPGPPEGPSIRVRVVGTDRSVIDFSTQGDQTGILTLGAPTYRQHRDRVVGFVAILRVRIAVDEQQRFPARVRALARAMDVEIGFETGGLNVAGVEDSLGVLRAGMLAFAAIAALGAAVTLIVLLARWAGASVVDQPTEHALGLAARQRAGAVALPATRAIVGGTIGALLLAWLGSALTPIGDARAIEPSPGLHVDAVALGLGALALLVAVGGIALVTATVATRRVRWDPARRRRTAGAGRWAEAVTRGPWPVPLAIGSRMALDPGRGPRAVPCRSAIAATAFGIAGIAAMLVVGTNLARLTDATPRWTWDFDTIVEGSERLTQAGGEPGSVPSCAPTASPVERIRGVAAVANVCSNSVTVAGRTLNTYGVRRMTGTILPTVLRGDLPRARSEILVGEKTLGAIDAGIGDTVRLRGENGRRRMVRITGTTFFPAPNSHDTVELADGVVADPDLLTALGNGSFPQLVVRWQPGADRAAGLARIRTLTGAPGIDPVRPSEIDRLLQLDNLPWILAAFLALLAAGALTHAIATNGARRRTELALLETYGFRPAQIRGALGSHAATLTAIGLLVGLPIGVVVGRATWTAIARDVGIASDTTLPMAAVLAIAPLALLLAVTFARWPARRVTQVPPAVALRSE